MPIYPTAGRLDHLVWLGVSEPLVRLASGDLIHPAFEERFLGPPVTSYWEEDDPRYSLFPDGPMFVPLWSYVDYVQGIWEVDDDIRFGHYFTETPDRVYVSATTEQGFLADMFFILFEDNWDDPADLLPLRDAAEAIGYRHFDEWATIFDGDWDGDDGYDGFERLCEKFLARIDALKTSRDRRR